MEENEFKNTGSELECEVCGFVAKSEFGLRSHSRKHERETEGPAVKVVTPVKATKPSSKELKEVQEELAANITTVGKVLHPLLINAKILKLQNPDLRLRVPGTNIEAPFPDFDTHLAYTLINRSEVTASLLVKYAEDNATLLKWLVRFNSWFKGGEVGTLIGGYAVATASSVGVQNPIIAAGQTFLLPDVVQLVEEENRALREQIAQMQAQMRAQPQRADERGSGN